LGDGERGCETERGQIDQTHLATDLFNDNCDKREGECGVKLWVQGKKGERGFDARSAQKKKGDREIGADDS